MDFVSIDLRLCGIWGEKGSNIRQPKGVREAERSVQVRF